MFNKLINRLPDNYKKDKNSINGKLYQIYSYELEQIKKAFDDIKKYQNVDKAVGKTLDHIGKNVLEYRDTAMDEDYRKWVKIKVLANRSNGDIEVINHILKKYMGDDFISLEDGWNSYVKEPASLVVNIKGDSKTVPYKVLNRIKSAGVRVYFTAGSDSINIIIDFKSYFFSVPYRICNMFRTDDVKGIIGRGSMKLISKPYNFEVPYLICGMFRTSGKGTLEDAFDFFIDHVNYENEVLYKRVGDTTIGEGDI